MASVRKRMMSPNDDREGKRPRFNINDAQETAAFMEEHENVHLKRRLAEIKREATEYREKLVAVESLRDEECKGFEIASANFNLLRERILGVIKSLDASVGKDMDELEELPAVFQKAMTRVSSMGKAELEKAHSNFVDQLKDLEKQEEAFTHQIADLKSKIAMLEKREAECVRDKAEAEDKLEATLRRLDKALEERSRVNDEVSTTGMSAPTSKPEDLSCSTSSDTGMSFDNMNETEALKTLKRQLFEANALAAGRNEELEHANQHLRNLQCEVNNLRMKLSQPVSPRRVFETDAYVSMKCSVEELEEEVERMRHKLKHVREEASERSLALERQLDTEKKQHQEKISRLDDQVKTLTGDNARMRQERRQLAFHLESAKGKGNLLSSFQEYQDLVDSQSAEIKRLRNQYKSVIESGVDPAENSLKAVLEELDATAKAFSDLETQYVKSLKEKTQTTKNESEWAALKSSKTMLEEAMSSLRRKVKKLEDMLVAKDTLVNQERSKNRSLEELVETLKEEIAAREEERQNNEQVAVQAQSQVERLTSALQQAQSARSEAERMVQEHSNQVFRVEQQMRELREENERLHSCVDKNSKQQGNLNSYIEEELNEIKARLKCPLCNERNKDAVIARCFHVFCRQCIRNVINRRSRKCPFCGVPFSQNDVKDIFIVE